jgi:amino acid transporter
MGTALPKGGPAGLFLGFVAYSTVILSVNQCFGWLFLSVHAVWPLTSPAEMVTYLPIPSPFVRLAGFWVDDALSFAMGWNYFFLMGWLTCLFSSCFDLTKSCPAFNIPYEITAIHVLLTYWTDKVSVPVVMVICIVLYRCVFSLSSRMVSLTIPAS